jgi:hypothetical protein
MCISDVRFFLFRFCTKTVYEFHISPIARYCTIYFLLDLIARNETVREVEIMKSPSFSPSYVIYCVLCYFQVLWAL